MHDLALWLTTQLDEDEQILREANTSPEMVTGIPRSYAAAPVALHIAEFADPARVLREIDIDRELLAEYVRLTRAYEAHRKEADRIAASADDDPIRRAALRREADYLPAMLHVMERWAKRKASAYSARPGYREEWRL